MPEAGFETVSVIGHPDFIMLVALCLNTEVSILIDERAVSFEVCSKHFRDEASGPAAESGHDGFGSLLPESRPHFIPLETLGRRASCVKDLADGRCLHGSALGIGYTLLRPRSALLNV